MLTKLVDSHPSITCEGEILAQASRLPRRAPLTLARGRAVRAARAARKAGSDLQVYGYKIIAADLRWHPAYYPDPAAFLRRAAGPDGLVVTLRRRNFLAQALSWVHAESTKYHFTSEDHEYEYKPMTVDPEMLLSMVYTYELDDKFLVDVAEQLDNKLALTYEDDLLDEASQRRSANSIAAALNLPPFTPHTDFRRVSPKSPLDRVSNRDEVITVFSATRFSGLLAALEEPADDS